MTHSRFQLDSSGKLLIHNCNYFPGTLRRRMAIAPNDPRHPDLTASDILSPQTWPRRGIRPRGRSRCHLHQDRGRFSDHDGRRPPPRCIGANLELLREATRADAAFHMQPRRRGAAVHRRAGGARHARHRQPGAAAGPELWMRCPGSSRASHRCGCRSCAIPGKPAARPGRGCRGVGQPRHRLDAGHRLLHRRTARRAPRESPVRGRARTGKCSCTCS